MANLIQVLSLPLSIVAILAGLYPERAREMISRRKGRGESEEHKEHEGHKDHEERDERAEGDAPSSEPRPRRRRKGVLWGGAVLLVSALGTYTGGLGGPEFVLGLVLAGWLIGGSLVIGLLRARRKSGL